MGEFIETEIIIEKPKVEKTEIVWNDVVCMSCQYRTYCNIQDSEYCYTGKKTEKKSLPCDPTSIEKCLDCERREKEDIEIIISGRGCY